MQVRSIAFPCHPSHHAPRSVVRDTGTCILGDALTFLIIEILVIQERKMHSFLFSAVTQRLPIAFISSPAPLLAILM